MRFPAPWRHARHWVDLELDRAGIPTEDSETDLESPWGVTDEFQPPDSNVLWPHAALNEHRSRPFSVPSDSKDAKDGQNSASGNVADNRERLTALWRLSASHGISWDELDQAYVSFASEGQSRYVQWSRGFENKGVLASRKKREAKDRAKAFFQRFAGRKNDPEERFPSRVKRLTSRIYREEKRKFLGPYGPGRLSAQLQQLVAARMVRRETEDRAYGLRANSRR
eukprot:TRINITY_DN22096_c0_g2_i3.p1 TRINITY_DN22096_c0_g2~~TRINITY_DN22096_c0_g2_i3.p1  ORF type:complete len:225 (+),score=27.29 TRINITY_DN22096_c0_g2_i3:144-818(+)